MQGRDGGTMKYGNGERLHDRGKKYDENGYNNKHEGLLESR
jgi:hypothetical protein